jgi:single-strand DNA-binding protein
MPSLNRVIIAGNLTRDPEVRYTPSGMAVADVSLAISDSYKNKAGELVEQVCYVDCVVWGRQAETTGEYLRKGSPALIEGKLQLDQWETNEGQKRSRLRVKADRVQFLGGPKKGEGGGGEIRSSAPAPAPAPPADSAPPPAMDDEDDLPF